MAASAAAPRRSARRRQHLLQIGHKGRLQQIGLLVLVGWEQEELAGPDSEVARLLADAALANQQDLSSVAERLHRDRPFLERERRHMWSPVP